jgi:aspartate racemase
MARHIGIVACSAEGAALCYRTISLYGAERMGRHAHPQVSLHCYPLSEYMDHIYRNDWRGVGEMMLASARKLAEMGADFLICPDNTLHIGWRWVARETPKPWLHIAEVVAREARARGYRRLAITGTKYTMEGPVYAEKLAEYGIEALIPNEGERAEIDRIIFEELVYGKTEVAALAYFQRVIAHLQSEGADAVVLGCTEIPLLINPANSPLPPLDSTRLLAHAAVEKALEAETAA